MVKINNFFGFILLFVMIIPQMIARTHKIDTMIKHEKQNNKSTREVEFRNDVCDLIELDLMSQKDGDAQLDKHEKECIEHFQETPLILRAEEKEYQTRHGDEINVETGESWELTLKHINNERLLSLGTFRDLVTEHFMPKKDFQNFLDTYILNPYNKAKLYVYRKVMARFAKTTFTIHTRIDPSHNSINCSDIILDIDYLAGQQQLAINVEHENILNMRITLKEAAYNYA
ncbi:MAG: hypothetical protein WD055_02235 [Candidatus Dependentiae bacterium]